MSTEIKMNKDIIVEAVLLNPAAILHIDNYLKHSIKFIRMMLRRNPECY